MKKESGKLHLDESGRARMVDVSAKGTTLRRARATGRVLMAPETLDAVERGLVKKGDVLGVAQVAAVMAAKKTPEIIPMCHPLEISSVDVSFGFLREGSATGVTIEAEVGCVGRTGVEMEAMVAVSAAALTIYDMCKAVDRWMTIEAVRLEEKSGGRSGRLRRPAGD